MKGCWKTVFLIILFLSGCATTASVTDNKKPAGELQGKNLAETAGRKDEEAVLATVNGEAITISEYNEKLKQLSTFEKARYRGEEGHKN